MYYDCENVYMYASDVVCVHICMCIQLDIVLPDCLNSPQDPLALSKEASVE